MTVPPLMVIVLLLEPPPIPIWPVAVTVPLLMVMVGPIRAALLLLTVPPPIPAPALPPVAVTVPPLIVIVVFLPVLE